jgi:hypothetical protein
MAVFVGGEHAMAASVPLTTSVPVPILPVASWTEKIAVCSFDTVQIMTLLILDTVCGLYLGSLQGLSIGTPW